MKLKPILTVTCASILVFFAPSLGAKTLLKGNALASYYGAPFHGRPTSSGEMFDMHGMTAAHKTLPFGTMLEIVNLENGNSVIVRVNDRGPHVSDREVDISFGAAEKLGIITSGIARVSIYILDDDEIGANSLETKDIFSETPLIVMPAQTDPSYEVTSTPVQATSPLPPNPAYGGYSNPLSQQNTSSEQPPAWSANTRSRITASSDNSRLWRIQIGAFSREENAIRLVRELRAVGLEPAYEKSDETIRVVLTAVEESQIEDVKNVLHSAGLYDYVLQRER